jgi:hypothetical protein
MDDLRTELDSLDERQLAYVVARSKCLSDSKALKESEIPRATFYSWDVSERKKLNELAQRFKRETAMRVLMNLQEHAEEASLVVAGLMKSRNDNIKLKSAQDILDRVVGKASQPVELTGKDGGAIVVNIKQRPDGN